MDEIVLIGFGGHAKSVIDTIETNGNYHIAGYVDKTQNLENRIYKWLGNDDDLEKIYNTGIHKAFITIGYMGEGKLRESIYDSLKKIGYEIPLIIDNSAIIARSVQIGEGTFIGKRVVVNADACIGKMCILNSGSIVEHECTVGDFSHISVGTVLCGQCRIGNRVFIGANATVIQNNSVGDNCIIGAGAVLRKHIDSGLLFYNYQKDIEKECTKY